MYVASKMVPKYQNPFCNSSGFLLRRRGEGLRIGPAVVFFLSGGVVCVFRIDSEFFSSDVQ